MCVDKGMPDSRVEVLKYALERCEKQIELELSLISARMTWLVISQSFLVGAFVAGGNIQPLVFGASVQALVSVIGLLISAWVRTGVNAALRVADRRKDEREPMLKSLSAELGFELPAVHRTDIEHIKGNRAPRWIPLMLIFAWVALMVMWSARVFLLNGW
jgi:hypothetical protein